MQIMCQKLNFNFFKSHAHFLNVYLFSKELAEDTLWYLKKLWKPCESACLETLSFRGYLLSSFLGATFILASVILHSNYSVNVSVLPLSFQTYLNLDCIRISCPQNHLHLLCWLLLCFASPLLIKVQDPSTTLTSLFPYFLISLPTCLAKP